MKYEKFTELDNEALLGGDRKEQDGNSSDRLSKSFIFVAQGRLRML
jgi:hypothetical protein